MNPNDVDRHITGNYGEDYFVDEDLSCFSDDELRQFISDGFNDGDDPELVDLYRDELARRTKAKWPDVAL